MAKQDHFACFEVKATWQKIIKTKENKAIIYSLYLQKNYCLEATEYKYLLISLSKYASGPF